MDVFEAHTHSFIVKIWLEDEAVETNQAEWRGQITHVTSGERRYVNNLDEISSFIKPYLQKMGVKFEKGWRLWPNFKRKKNQQRQPTGK